MSVQMIPAYVLQVPNWVQPPMRTITVHATREGVETPDYKVCRVYDNIDINEMAVDMPLRDGVEVSMSFLAEAVDGPRAFMMIDSQPSRYSAVRLINVDSDLDININLAGVAEDTRGQGILSGSFPLSLLTDNNQLPNQAQIRVLYRPTHGEPGDGTVVATTTCNVDGSWQVSGLNENEKFDVVARIPGYNDVIISNVQPSGAPLSAHFANLKEEYEYQEEVEIQVVALGGRPPYTFTTIELPEGLSIDSNTGYITGIMLGKKDLIFRIAVNDSENTVVNVEGGSYVEGDPHWDKVVALLHFDDETDPWKDETGKVWTAGGTANISPANPLHSSYSLEIRGGAGSITAPSSTDFYFDADFTIEAFILSDAGAIDTPLLGYSSNVNELLPLYLDSASSGRVFWKESDAITSLTLPVGVWFHYALTRQGGTLRAFVNGILAGSAANGQAVGLSTGSVSLGGTYPEWYYQGWRGQLDELRITKGVARYTENFTPPTEPFPNF